MAMSVVYTNVGGMLLYEKRGATETEYVPDLLGSVAKCKNGLGAYTYSAEYWPYGEVQTQTGTNPGSWNFAGLWGYFRDLEALVYVRSRFLRTDRGRWLTVDPLWPAEEAYAYVDQQPTMLVDYYGLQGKDKTGKVKPPKGYVVPAEVRYCQTRLGDCIKKCAAKGKVPITCVEARKDKAKWEMTVCTCGDPPGKDLIWKKILKIIGKGGSVTACANVVCAGFFTDCVMSVWDGREETFKEAVCNCWNAYNEAIEDEPWWRQGAWLLMCDSLMDLIWIGFGCRSTR